MVASVQELILAAKAGQTRSPFAELIESGMAGWDKGRQDRSDNVDVTMKLMQIEQMRQENEYQTEQMAKLKAKQEADLKAQREQNTKQAFNGVGGAPKAVVPTQKLKEKTTVDGKGHVSTIYETVDPPNSLDEISAARVQSGEISLEDAYKLKNRSDIPSLNLQHQMNKDAAEAAAKQKAKAVPGYDKSGNVEIDEVEARKLREGVAEFNTFKTGLEEYRALIRQHGTTQPTDRRVQGQLSAYAKNLQLKVKNLAQLGVLSASDIPYIEEQIPGPGMLRTKEGMLGALDTAEKLMQSAIDSKLDVSGYKKASGPVGGGQEAPRVGGTFNGEKVLKVERVD